MAPLRSLQALSQVETGTQFGQAGCNFIEFIFDL
jgi:hypothetical protein